MKDSKKNTHAFCFVEDNGDVQLCSADFLDRRNASQDNFIRAELVLNADNEGSDSSVVSDRMLTVAAETLAWLFEQELLLKTMRK